MTVRDSAPCGMAFQAMIEEADHRRRVWSGKTEFRQVDNLLYLPEENARFGTWVFPHPTRRWTRGFPKHGLETRAT